jgi:hypothetical protein
LQFVQYYPICRTFHSAPNKIKQRSKNEHEKQKRKQKNGKKTKEHKQGQKRKNKEKPNYFATVIANWAGTYDKIIRDQIKRLQLYFYFYY